MVSLIRLRVLSSLLNWRSSSAQSTSSSISLSGPYGEVVPYAVVVLKMGASIGWGVLFSWVLYWSCLTGDAGSLRGIGMSDSPSYVLFLPMMVLLLLGFGVGVGVLWCSVV